MYVNKKIIIEIPHQSRVRTWVAYNDADIINRAYELGLIYELKNENKDIIQVCLRDYHEGEFYKEDKAPTKLECAMDCISYDLHSCYFLTMQEAHEFIKNYRGHKKLEVKQALEIKILYEELKDIKTT
tara:strand:+ start:335 stop:718 length:384 start_codon:yes stop_codon:yes gene_type:complete